MPTGDYMPRVLMSAYQCGPGMGSVSQIGWEWYHRVAARTPLTLVTHVRNRDALEAAGAPVNGSDIVYIDTEWFASPLYRVASKLFPRSQHAVFMLSSLDFYVFDHAALGELRRRQAGGGRWDVLHAPTPVSPVAASVLHRLGIPTILGPLNGGLASPDCFPEFMKQDAAWLYPLRNAGRLLDWKAGSTRHAARILTATAATRDWYPRRYRGRCTSMLENAVDLDRFPAKPWPAPPGPGVPLRILFVGRLVPFKAIPLLLRAMGRLGTDPDCRLTVVGEGPMLETWRDESRRLGIGDRVEFAGARPLDEVGRFMDEAHVFCLPSVRESGGAVLLEAMSSARPVIALDYGGPAELVDDAVGCKVPATGNEAAIDGIAAALRDLRDNPDAWRRRGLAGRERVVARYSWDAKIDAAVALYREITTQAVSPRTE